MNTDGGNDNDDDLFNDIGLGGVVVHDDSGDHRHKSDLCEETGPSSFLNSHSNTVSDKGNILVIDDSSQTNGESVPNENKGQKMESNKGEEKQSDDVFPVLDVCCVCQEDLSSMTLNQKLEHLGKHKSGGVRRDICGGENENVLAAKKPRVAYYSRKEQIRDLEPRNRMDEALMLASAMSLSLDEANNSMDKKEESIEFDMAGFPVEKQSVPLDNVHVSVPDTAPREKNKHTSLWSAAASPLSSSFELSPVKSVSSVTQEKPAEKTRASVVVPKTKQRPCIVEVKKPLSVLTCKSRLETQSSVSRSVPEGAASVSSLSQSAATMRLEDKALLAERLVADKEFVDVLVSKLVKNEAFMSKLQSVMCSGSNGSGLNVKLNSNRIFGGQSQGSQSLMGTAQPVCRPEGRDISLADISGGDVESTSSGEFFATQLGSGRSAELSAKEKDLARMSPVKLMRGCVVSKLSYAQLREAVMQFGRKPSTREDMVAFLEQVQKEQASEVDGSGFEESLGVPVNKFKKEEMLSAVIKGSRSLYQRILQFQVIKPAEVSLLAAQNDIEMTIAEVKAYLESQGVITA